MIAAIKKHKQRASDPDELCIVYVTRREGFAKVAIISFCDQWHNGADKDEAVLQVPDKSITCETCKAECLKKTGHAYDS